MPKTQMSNMSEGDAGKYTQIEKYMSHGKRDIGGGKENVHRQSTENCK